MVITQGFRVPEIRRKHFLGHFDMNKIEISIDKQVRKMRRLSSLKCGAGVLAIGSCLGSSAPNGIN